MGTNPIVFSMPSSDPSLSCWTVPRQSTSAGRLKYAREDKPTPRGAVLSKDGVEMTDSKAILQAFLSTRHASLRLAGPGSRWRDTRLRLRRRRSCALRFGTTAGERNSLAYIGERAKARRPSLLGHFFIAIDVSAFTELSRFKEITGKICKGFVTDPTGPGQIYTAEPEHMAWTHRSHFGGTQVPTKLQQGMVELRDNFPPALKKKARLPSSSKLELFARAQGLCQSKNRGC